VPEVELSEVLDDLLLDGALEGEVELLKGLPGRGKRAALIRFSLPWDSREETSVERTASRKRSCDHSSSRARSA
jgi:KaiC/GvpD/RAD55 family RecA-like ATPase